MTACMIAQIRIDDAERYQSYLAGFLEIFQRYDGEILVTSATETEVIEGTWALPRTVVLRFSNCERASAWYRDPDYQALATHRHEAAEANLVLVESIDAAGDQSSSSKG